MSLIHNLDSIIDQWFIEDIREGDHTTLSTIPAHATGSAELKVKQDGIIAGIGMAERIFKQCDESLALQIFLTDGTSITVGDIAFRVSGKLHAILQSERLVLNIMQRMSGIATTTRAYVNLLEGTDTRILDTRKTTPGFRMLEKEAVRLGGGFNHRFGLFDMILIKDNHIDFAGGIEQAIRGTRKYLQTHQLDLLIEVETRSIADIEKVLSIGGVHRIMLDNFSLEDTRKAVEIINHRFETESSGAITHDNIRAYAECGVDFISIGALTHQINSLDLSLKAI